ncbi:MAG: response regulator transcription factor [Planctomycetota bacterium]
MSVTILLAEDHIVMREGLRSLIDQQNDMKVVGEADNGKMALELAEELKPDVIIMDVAMPDMNGIEATGLIKEKMPDIKVIALSAYDNREYVMGMVKAGVSGYLLKDCVFEELVNAIETVVQGKSYLCPEIATIVLKAQADSQNRVERAVLNQRDINVIKLLTQGLSARQIAQQEGLSVKTIEGRRRRIMEKLSINNMPELIRYAMEEGLISAKSHD